MYLISRNGQQAGPFSLDELKAQAAAGELQPGDLVWQEDTASWQPASSVHGLFTSGTPGTVHSLPGPPPTAPPVGNKNVDNHFTFAILATLLCCLPTGAVAIVYAAQSSARLAEGDEDAAIIAANKAKRWCWVSVVASVAATLITAWHFATSTRD